jgi:hypothetical protein
MRWLPPESRMVDNRPYSESELQQPCQDKTGQGMPVEVTTVMAPLGGAEIGALPASADPLGLFHWAPFESVRWDPMLAEIVQPLVHKSTGVRLPRLVDSLLDSEAALLPTRGYKSTGFASHTF